MCAQFQFLEDGSSGELTRIAAEIDRSHGSGAWSRGDIRPSDPAPVLVPSSSGPVPDLQFWGFPSGGRLVINARSESALEKPLFRDCVQRSRCVIPASGFYEWDRDRRKHCFTMPGEHILFLAGLFCMQEGRPRFTVLTAPANPSVEKVHSRMPLVLTRGQVEPWIFRPEAAPAILRCVPPALRDTDLEDQLSLWT